jgi:hypothetical protein
MLTESALRPQLLASQESHAYWSPRKSPQEHTQQEGEGRYTTDMQAKFQSLYELGQNPEASVGSELILSGVRGIQMEVVVDKNTGHLLAEREVFKNPPREQQAIEILRFHGSDNGTRIVMENRTQTDGSHLVQVQHQSPYDFDKPINVSFIDGEQDTLLPYQQDLIINAIRALDQSLILPSKKRSQKRTEPLGNAA